MNSRDGVYAFYVTVEADSTSTLAGRGTIGAVVAYIDEASTPPGTHVVVWDGDRVTICTHENEPMPKNAM